MVGVSVFESDSATAYIADLFMNGYGLLEVALDRVLDEEAPADLIECEEALVAVEFIAAVIGHPAYDFPEDGREWVADQLPTGSAEQAQVAGLVDKAANVIDKIVTDSELRDLWEGSVSYNDWFNNLVSLQNRLLGEQDVN